MGALALIVFLFQRGGSGGYAALEGFTETLQKELNPAWNIKVSTTLPSTIVPRVKPSAYACTGTVQISSVLCGGFVSSFKGSMQIFPQHPAYTFEGANASAATREWILKSEEGDVEAQKKLGFSDTTKAVQKIYELSELPNPPLRLLLGKDINKLAREYIAQLTQEADAYEAWSDDLAFEGN